MSTLKLSARAPKAEHTTVKKSDTELMLDGLRAQKAEILKTPETAILMFRSVKKIYEGILMFL